MIRGIDISHWNGNIDFDRVKASGIDFVIIKAGGSDYGFYTDKMFKLNYEKAKAAGLNVGAYYFVGKKFLGAGAGVADAMRFLQIINGMQFEYPVFLDLETTPATQKEEATKAAKAFCETMEKAGYFVGIYASDISGFKEKLIRDDLTQYAFWVARYSQEQPQYVKEWQMWQYTSKGVNPGVSGSVDLDQSKIDYSLIMKKKGLNGFKKETKDPEAPKKTKAKKAQKEVHE